jgi:uncharacterized protein YuzE
MKITYDKLADAAYIYLKIGKVFRTEEKANMILCDYDAKGEVLGIEILSPSLNLEKLPLVLKEMIGPGILAECKRIMAMDVQYIAA